ncbi:MAG: exo-alpha-sialidase [Desulfurococcales archaeon]|nr:exo-alpha-sialidase [Desulfurococcales archaeon]
MRRILPAVFLLVIVTVSAVVYLAEGGKPNWDTASLSFIGSSMLAQAMEGGIGGYGPELVASSQFLIPRLYADTPSQGADSGEAIGISFARNVKLSVDLGRPYEHEPTLAVNPLDPNNVVAAAHHEDTGPLNVVVGVYYSFDGGMTWEGPVPMPPAEPTDFLASDPALTAGPSGAFYLTYFSVGPRMSETVRFWFSSTIIVAKSVDGGASWEVVLKLDPFYIDFEGLRNRGIFVSNVLLDKEYIAAGPGPSGDIVVVSYTEFMDGYDSTKASQFTRMRIMAVISLDGGRTWKGPVQVSDEVYIYYRGPQGGVERVIQGSNPAVGPDGTIYIAYYDSGEDGWLAGRARIMVVKSVDGGETWSEPIEAAVIEGEMEYYSPARFRAWSSMFPVMDVAPDGTVYIVYASADPNTRDPGDVFLVYSQDGGETWSEPMKVNSDGPGNYQFFPWLDVDEEGVVHIMWGDTRLDPDMFGYDIFYARYAPEEGLTPNVRVSDYTANGFLAFFLGDYFNLAAAGGNVYAVWTDVREAIKERGGFTFIFADSSIYFARLGERPKPKLSLEVSEAPAGRSLVTALRGEGLPVNAIFLPALNGVVVDRGFIFTDEEGRVEATVILPPLAEGEYELSLVDITTLTPYATVKITVKDEVAAAASEASARAVEAVETVNAAFRKLESLESTMSTMVEGIAEVSRKVEETGRSLEETVRAESQATREEVAKASEDVKAAVKSEVASARDELKKEVESQGEATREEVRNSSEKQIEAINSLSSKLDSYVEEIKGMLDGLQSSLQGSLTELRGLTEEAIERASSASTRSALSSVGAFLAFLAALLVAAKVLVPSLRGGS